LANQEKKERLAALLNAYLAAENISSRELARRLKLNPTSISSYLQAVSLPSEKTRETIARLLKMTPRELEAELNAVALQPEREVEQLKRDIRLLEHREFLEVAEVVIERLLSEMRSQL